MAAALAAARVVDVEEAVGQGTHGVGRDHGFRSSVSVDGIERGPRQARPRVGNQGPDEHQLGPARRGAVASAHAPEAARAADAGPVRGAAHRAAVARRVDERLQQQQRMAEALRPVRRQAPLAQRQHPRTRIRRPPQDQEPAVVRDQVQPCWCTCTAEGRIEVLWARYSQLERRSRIQATKTIVFLYSTGQNTSYKIPRRGCDVKAAINYVQPNFMTTFCGR